MKVEQIHTILNTVTNEVLGTEDLVSEDLGNIVDVGVKEGIVQKSGAWFSYGDIRLGQGRENAKIYLKDNPEIALEIENKIREKHNLPLNTTPIVSIEKEDNETVEDTK